MEEEAKSKLDKERYNLTLFEETVKKSSQLSNGMCNILTSFDEHLMKLERTILPVYQETGNLQRRQENINKTLEKLDYVIHFYNVSKEVEPVIRNGPGDSLNVYLDSMGKIQNAIAFFEANNPSCEELDILNSLFEKGGDSLEFEFRALLSRYSQPIQPVVILDLVGLDDEMPHEEVQAPLEQIPEKARNDLERITDWLRRNKNEDFVNVYVSIRSNALTHSLKGLKDHQKSSSGSSSTLAVQSSPHLGVRRNIIRDTPPRRAPGRIQQAFMKKATAIMRYSPTVESTVLGQRLQTALLPEPKDEIPEQEILAYLTSVNALLKLMQSELQLMQGIILSEQQTKVFERVVKQALDNLISEGEVLISRVKKCVAKHDFLTVLNLFPILRHLISMKPEFDNLFEDCSKELRDKLQIFITTLQTTIFKSLEEFNDCIKNDPDTKKMPKDGTVHELTSNVMLLLQQLQDNLDTLMSVLCVTDSGTVTSSRHSFAQYITRVLSSLGLTIHNKSESYNDIYLKSIFRINNFHYILKSLQRSGLLDIVHAYNKNIEGYYNEQIRDQKRIYSQSWSRVLHYVMEVDKPVSQPRTVPSTTSNSSLKLKDKERQNIKDKFTGFNKEIEEIFRVQKAYAIPDLDLRESLKRDNKDFILPKYTMFYDKYVTMAFTKNPDKYLKYTPTEVSNLIDKFFDAAA